MRVCGGLKRSHDKSGFNHNYARRVRAGKTHPQRPLGFSPRTQGSRYTVSVETWAAASGTHWHSSHPWATLWGLGASIIRGLLSAKQSVSPFPQLPCTTCVAPVEATVCLSPLFLSNKMKWHGGRYHFLSPFKMRDVCCSTGPAPLTRPPVQQTAPTLLGPLGSQIRPWKPPDACTQSPGQPRADLSGRRGWHGRLRFGQTEGRPRESRSEVGPTILGPARRRWGLGVPSHTWALGLRGHSCTPWQ